MPQREVSSIRQQKQKKKKRADRTARVAGYRTSAAVQAAQNFTMPALSPTMTEGNIAKWQVKEGEKFSAGDVLLEIETDKATMDVEAQEDGILMKIVQGDGTKSIQVGTRIAVIAEEGDDISTLEPPADNAQGAAPPVATSQQDPVPSDAAPPTSSTTPKPTAKSGSQSAKQRYPPLPSVFHLLKENGLGESALGDITPTGPNGRILKGDMLAYLGKISAQTPSDISKRFEKNSHLDLSNIRVAKAAEPKKVEKAAPSVPEPPKEAVIQLSISVEAIQAVQKTLQKKLGLELPFSSFVVRASDIANEQLPRAKPSRDQLFNQLLGLESDADYFSRGAYLPDIGTVRSISTAPSDSKTARPKQADIFDILSGESSRSTKSVAAGPLGTPAATFSLAVPSAEAERATVFLQRVKALLETEPEKLVL